jgi:hypothetical protein
MLFRMEIIARSQQEILAKFTTPTSLSRMTPPIPSTSASTPNTSSFSRMTPPPISPQSLTSQSLFGMTPPPSTPDPSTFSRMTPPSISPTSISSPGPTSPSIEFSDTPGWSCTPVKKLTFESDCIGMLFLLFTH